MAFLSSVVSPEAAEAEREGGTDLPPPGLTSRPSSTPELASDALEEEALRQWREAAFDAIRAVRDPEKPQTLEELDVVREELVRVERRRAGGDEGFVATVGFVPTVPHCSLATLIGLCLRTRLQRSLPPELFKVDLFVQPGSHQTAEEITKQINDKERVAAAMENPNLSRTVEECIREEE